MKKFILKLDLHDEKDKRKALKTVSALGGIDSISMDMKGKTLTVIGTVDPVSVVSKLRKFWPTDMVLLGPAKEPEKEEAKKEEPKKEEPKKEEPKNEEPKKEEEKKKEPESEPEPAWVGIMPYRPYYPPMNTYGIMPFRPYYPPMNTYSSYVHDTMEEDPNACVIC